MPKQDISSKKIAMLVAFRDFRDEEYFTPKKIFTASGADTKTASNKKGIALGADGGEARVDFLTSELNVTEFDSIVFIGGPGCLRNLDNEDSWKVARETVLLNKPLAAICISPVVLAKAGVLEGKRATVWTSPLDKRPIRMLEEGGAAYQEAEVVVDGNIITADGPAAAKQFAEAIIKFLQ